MKLRTKLIGVFAALTVLSTGALTVFSTVSQRSNYIDNELSKQRQVLTLLQSNISGQYYNYINQQILAAFAVRSELKTKARMIDALLADRDLSPEKLQQFLAARQPQLQEGGLDLALLQSGQLTLPPLQKEAMQGRSVGGQDLQETMLAAYRNQRQSYYLSLYQQQSDPAARRHGNFLSYTFISRAYPDCVFTLLQNIDHLLDEYAADNDMMIELLRGGFRELSAYMQGTALTADACSLKVLLSASSEQEALSQLSLSLEQPLAPLKSGQQRLLQFEQDGQMICAAYFRPLNWYILTLRSADAILQPAFRQAAISAGIGLAVLLLSVLTAFAAASRLTSKLSLIASRARSLNLQMLQDQQKLDDFTAALQVKSNDEVGDLKQAIVQMCSALSLNLTQLMQATQLSERLEGELNAARQIQLGMLPESGSLPVTQTLQCAGFLEPAKAVGGDFYDAFYLNPERTKAAFIIGDVSDKGVPAALFMSMTLSLIKGALSMGMPPAQAVSAVNTQLSERNPNLMFVTLYCAVIDLANGEFEAVNAGHCPPILCTIEEVSELNEISGPAAGPLSEISYTSYKARLPEHSCLLLYTDGVSEAQNSKLEFFGSEKIRELAQRLQFYRLPPQQTMELVLKEIADFRGDYMQTDDITLFCLSRL